MLQGSYPLYLANRAQTPNTDLEVTDKFTGKVATRVPLAGADLIDRAFAAAAAAMPAMRKYPAWKRREVLEHCVKRFGERAEELAMALCIEAGKPIKDSRGEVTRLIDTFRIAAGEATRIVGEVLPMDISERTENYVGQWKRVTSDRARSSRRSTSR